MSFTGILTFKNGQNIRDTLAATPLDKFMLETDCPYLAPVPNRGKRNEPAWVAHTVARLAVARRVDENRMRKTVADNARALFKLA